MFFDFPHIGEPSEDKYVATIDNFDSKCRKHLRQLPVFYIDDFNFDDSISIQGNLPYKYILDKLLDFLFIPVVGLDRDTRRIDLVKSYKMRNRIRSNEIAIRFTKDDFTAFRLIEDDLRILLGQIEGFDDKHCIIDLRQCRGLDTEQTTDKIIRFMAEIQKTVKPCRIVVSGSSLPPSLGSIVTTETSIVYDRIELEIMQGIKKRGVSSDNLFFGDYTTISPEFSFVPIDPRLYPKITAPKIVYPFGSKFYISRGGSIQSKGNDQCYQLCNDLVKKAFFRGHGYSLGDSVFYEKAQGIPPRLTPPLMVRNSINAHLEFMVKTFDF